MDLIEARQAADGRWFWSEILEERVIAFPPCTSACRHEQRVDAEWHFYEHRVATLQERELEAPAVCAVLGCGVETARALASNVAIDTPLCDVHRSPAGYRIARPFDTGIRIGRIFRNRPLEPF